MSAPALNIAAPPMPGATVGSGSSASPAQGQAASDPMAGFEAVLATLFGLKDVAGLPTETAKTNAKGAAPTSDAGKTEDSPEGDPTTADKADSPAITAPDATLALLVPAVPVPLIAPAATAGSAQGNAADASAIVTDASAKPQVAFGPAIPPDETPKGQATAAEPTPTDTAAAQGAAPAAAPKPAATPMPPIAAAPVADPAPPATPLAAAPIAIAAEGQPPALQVMPQETPPALPAGNKEKPAIGKVSPRIEANRPAGAPDIAATAGAPASAPSLADAATTTTADDKDPQGPQLEAKADSADAPARQSDVNTVTETTTTPTTLTHPAALAVRGSPQTVANLAAQIVKKLEGRSTQFDVQLDPAGLGKVDVRVAIGADGRISATMSFDNPQAAADVKSRANELHAALQQAGFDISGGLSFDVTGGGGQGQGQGAQDQSRTATPTFRGQAFQTALDTLGDNGLAGGLSLRSSPSSGVDIRI